MKTYSRSREHPHAAVRAAPDDPTSEAEDGGVSQVVPELDAARAGVADRDLVIFERFEQGTTLREIFEQIDAMPMRQREMRERRAEP
jgi:hypothetical protein